MARPTWRLSQLIELQPFHDWFFICRVTSVRSRMCSKAREMSVKWKRGAVRVAGRACGYIKSMQAAYYCSLKKKKMNLRTFWYKMSLLKGWEWTIFSGCMKWKSWKFSFSRNARVHRSWHRAGDPCHAMPWCQQSRTAQARGARMTRQRAEDQQLYNRTSLTSWAHRGSLSKWRELVVSSLPPPPFFFRRFLAPGLWGCFSFPCICSPPVCIICSVTSLSLAKTTWTPEHPFFSTHCYPNTSSDITCVLRGGSFPVTTHGLSSRGVAAVRARRLFPSTISGVRGSVPILPLGQKLDWQPVLSLATSHSSKDPPSLAYWLFASPQLNSVRWCCRGHAKRENVYCLTRASCCRAEKYEGIGWKSHCPFAMSSAHWKALMYFTKHFKPECSSSDCTSLECSSSTRRAFRLETFGEIHQNVSVCWPHGKRAWTLSRKMSLLNLIMAWVWFSLLGRCKKNEKVLRICHCSWSIVMHFLSSLRCPLLLTKIYYQGKMICKLHNTSSLVMMDDLVIEYW